MVNLMDKATDNRSLSKDADRDEVVEDVIDQELIPKIPALPAKGTLIELPLIEVVAAEAVVEGLIVIVQDNA